MGAGWARCNSLSITRTKGFPPGSFPCVQGIDVQDRDLLTSFIDRLFEEEKL
jgi:hypothetical protein